MFFSHSHDEFSDADTEGFYTAVQEKILARYGKVFDWSVKAKMMGKTTAESTRILFEECGLTGLLTTEQFLEEREIMLKELLPTCVAMPGDEDYLSNLSVSAGTTYTVPIWYGYMTVGVLCHCHLLGLQICPIKVTSKRRTNIN